MPSVILSDFDCTLAHKLRDGDQRSVGDYFVDERAISLISKWRGSGRFMIASGRRSQFARSLEGFPCDAALLEHGCVIMRNGVLDREWDDRMQSYKDDLTSFEDYLRSLGYHVDVRHATMRVYKDTWNLDEPEKQYLESLQRPDGIMFIRNREMLDIIPKDGGKENAASYMLGNLGVGWNAVAAMGDDLNDLGMLRNAARSATLQGAHPEIVRYVSASGGYVSPHALHRGTVDVLEHLVLQ